jgi:salicylate hydroxylase
MAIEDGYVLAHCLRQHSDVNTALRTYETLRKPRVSRVQSGARERGKRLHLANPDAIVQRNSRDAQDPARRAREMDWVYRHDVVTEYGPLTESPAPA